MGCFVVAEFLLTGASRGPFATAEPLVFVKLSKAADCLKIPKSIKKTLLITAVAPYVAAAN